MYQVDYNHPVHVHFIGIGGISMSGLAEILIDRGFTVTGSDMNRSELTDHLASIGAGIRIGQRAENITDDIDLVVYTAAIRESNEEYAAAVSAGIPMLSRAALLGQIMANYPCSIGVSGTHGKTTTTSMLTHILLQAGKDPTVSVGGMLDRIGGNIRVGNSDVFLTEACEYTNSFLEFHPLYPIILNVEEDHMDFFKDIDDIVSSFRQFASQAETGGKLIINGDMEHTDAVTRRLQIPVITFGLNPANDYSAKDIRFDRMGNASFTLLKSGKESGRFSLAVKGKHNVLNALAAIACAEDIGLSADEIQSGLLSFSGTHRRFEYKGQMGDVIIVDDYAHHPTEIRATIAIAKEIPHKDLWVVFQPHTYTRTIAFLEDFADALSGADHVILADIYAAREKDPGTVSSRDIQDLILQKGTDAYYCSSFEEIEDFIRDRVSGTDLLITMGAGNIVEVGEDLLRTQGKA